MPTGAGPAVVAPEVFEHLGVTHLALTDQPLDTIEACLRARGDAGWWDGEAASLRGLVEVDDVQARLVAAHTGIALWRWRQPEDAVRDLRGVLDRLR